MFNLSYKLTNRLQLLTALVHFYLFIRYQTCFENMNKLNLNLKELCKIYFAFVVL